MQRKTVRFKADRKCKGWEVFVIKKSKFNNAKIITSDGLKFDSRKELKRYKELLAKAENGEITNLQRQVKYELIPAQREPDKVGPRGGKVSGKLMERAVSYYADFVYVVTATGKTVVEDVKGYKQGNAYSIFKIKRKLMLYVHGITVKEV